MITLLMPLCPSALQDAVRRFVQSPTSHRLAKGTFWSAVGAFGSRGFALLSSVLIARMLGREGFGELAIIQSTVGMFAVFAGFGLGTTATRYVAELRTTDPSRAGRIVVLTELFAVVSGGTMATLLFVLARPLATHTLAAVDLGSQLQLGALLLLLNALSGVQTGALAGFEAFKAVARTSFWSGILSFPLMVGGVYVAQLSGAVGGLVASAVVNCVLNHFALAREMATEGVACDVRGCLRELGVVWQFSLPAALASSLVGPVAWAANAVLVRQPNGYLEMGTYNASLTLHSILLLTAATVGAPLLPMIADHRSAGDRRLERINMTYTWFVGVVLAVPLLSLPECLQALFGADFAGPSFRETFVVVILFTCVIIYKQGLARVLAANDLMWWGVASNAFWGALVLVGAALLIRWGALGLALANAVAYTLNTLVFMPLYTTRRLVPRNTALSLEAMVIWLVLCSLTAMAWLGTPLLVRALLVPVSLAVVVRGFLRLLDTSQQEPS